MRGEIPMGSGDAASLATISGLFAAQKGTYWIAGGIQFTSFGLIQGKVIVAVQFGNKFSFNLLGLAAFGISPVAYFELGIEITADEEKFLLKAGLSKNSYIIHPDIFSLQGDFGLGIWYASPHKGDFILSIGGYHPYFAVPVALSGALARRRQVHDLRVRAVVGGSLLRADAAGADGRRGGIALGRVRRHRRRARRLHRRASSPGIRST